jgi:peptidylprolyl isomerase
MRTISPALIAVVAFAAIGAAPLPHTAIKSPGEIAAAAPPDAWRPIAPDNLLVMELAGGRQVTLELAPGFAPAHVANIRALVRAGWFDGAAIVRVQDNYVVQWGGADDSKPLPKGIAATVPAEYDRPLAGLAPRWLPYADAYAPKVGHVDGWPVASDGRSVWLTHCYGMVGVGRDMPPDTGTGAELYTVIGQAPRHLDRNTSLVGRIVSGIDVLTALPRGTGDLGFYTDPAQRTAIRKAWMAIDRPATERPRFEVLRTDSASFAAYADARANRRDTFFVRPAGGADLCNIPVPVRPAR